MAGKLRHLALISRHYPSPRHPYDGMFVEQLARAIIRRGVRCTPIHPVKAHYWVQDLFSGGKRAPRTGEENGCGSVRPVYVSASSRQVGPVNTAWFTQASFQRAALRAIRRLDAPPDAVYGHFLYCGGGAAVWIGKRIDRPSFAAVGEGTFWSVNALGWQRARRDYRDVTGVIAVSSLVKKRLVAELYIPADKIVVFPNGVDRTRFFPRSRREARDKYGLPQDRFLVAFVGNFLHAKGVARVAEAIDGLDGVGGLFAGVGPLVPSGPGVLFAGRLPHEAVPEILSAADVFVLPTLAEGSCNAIVEAMACGLPVVTSDGEFNDDLVDESVSIRVDPMDVAAIRRAIVTLRDDAALRNRLAAAALVRAEQFDIDRRAERICTWIEARM